MMAGSSRRECGKAGVERGRDVGDQAFVQTVEMMVAVDIAEIRIDIDGVAGHYRRATVDGDVAERETDP